MADVLTIEQRKKNMQHIRCKDTKIEVTLRKALWKQGYRYRKNYNLLPGKPDIVLTKYRIVIFCDSEFFHGKNWGQLKNKLRNSNNGSFWIDKIGKNIERDLDIDKQLQEMGWIVLRFWGQDILKNTEQCVLAVEEMVLEQKLNSIERF